MNSFEEKIEAVKEELAIMARQYEAIQALQAENKIEQDKIVEQNLTIKHNREELRVSQKKVEDKELDLAEREKQIIIKEKTIIASNHLLNEKMDEFRRKTVEINQQSTKLQKNQAEYNENKKKLDTQALIYNKLEATEAMRNTRMKNKEEEVEKELKRLRDMRV